MKLLDRLSSILAGEQPASGASPRPTRRRLEPGEPGQGTVDRRCSTGMRQIALRLDQPTFDRVRDYATARNINFAAAARELIKRGAAKSSATVRTHRPDSQS